MKRLLVLVAVGAAAYFLYTHRAISPGKEASPAPPSASAWSGADCVAAAERANSELQQAARLLLRPPVDFEAWRSAEGSVSAAISAAESACAGAPGGNGVADEVGAALAGLRVTLGELSAGARGAGGVMSIVQRQEEIDGHLGRAKALLGK